MSYIIDQAKWIVDNEIIQNSILIKENRIQSLRKDFRYYNHIRMNVSPFLMSPVHVMADLHFPLYQNHIEQKEYYKETFLSKGCTTFLTTFSITFLSQFELQLKKLRTSLINSPIDYVIGLECPAHLLTPDLIRKCKKNKIPVIFLIWDHDADLSNIPWGWIKEASFGYPITFAPKLMTNVDVKKRKKKIEFWEKLFIKEKLPHLIDEIPQKTPLSLMTLKKLGIYPKRGNFLVGGEVSYNLYEIESNQNLDEEPTFHYDMNRIMLSVNKGKVLKLYDQMFFYPGEGEELRIDIPGFFK
ncbi:hypothetical protein JOC86_000878 [Bacillus pakistanensis]|uniref:Uncharacterized protein n=1 Tax=Rossellomorea pakistanensis TaxID=992288 RepID=A0ABS2N914_9BACI|nr:hypothetical protein [Bacillus pakistanensis]MBM7584341.1 hypothetical protein [Bacillus pakistanensis]